MKLKSKTVKYPTESALQNHLLQGMLPTFITRGAYEQPQLPKCQDFYKSDEFIWNNPYRSSKKIYRYYHQNKRDNEGKLKAMRQSELTDRQLSQQQRIQFIRELRNQQLMKMSQRKHERMKLEAKSKQKRHQGMVKVVSQTPTAQRRSPINRGLSAVMTTRRLAEVQKAIERDYENQEKIRELVRSETLKNRSQQCEKLKKRHDKNLLLMTRAGIRTQTNWNWTTFRMNTQVSELQQHT